MPRRCSPLPVVVLLALATSSACTSIDADLRQATTLYEEARYEEVELWVAALGRERSSMSAAERLRFEYLAGASAHRLGRAEEAYHHLLLAAVLKSRAPRDTLSDEDRLLLERMLQELKQGTRL